MNKHQFIYNSIVKSGYQDRSSVFVFEIYHGPKKKNDSKNLFDKVSILEKQSLDYLRKQDRILDIGAGAGRLTVYLQKKGYNITALEKSKTICNILRKRNIKKIINTDIFKYFPKNKYDVALFVKVFSIFGKKKENVAKFLNFLTKKILNKNGKIIFVLTEPESRKTGITKRRFIFKEKTGPWFESIYPSAKDVMKIARKNGLLIEKFERDNSNHYFLILKNKL